MTRVGKTFFHRVLEIVSPGTTDDRLRSIVISFYPFLADFR